MDRGCAVSPDLFLISIVTSIPCALYSVPCTVYITSSLLQILEKLFSSPQRAHVTFFLKRDKHELAFGFCAACMLSYRCLQMEWWAAVTIVAISLQPALLMWPCVSAARPSVLLPWASHAVLNSRHPVDCILPILDRKLAVGVFPATAISNRLLRFRVSRIHQHKDVFNGFWVTRVHQHTENMEYSWNLFVTQILPQHKPSCILSQHEVRYPCAV